MAETTKGRLFVIFLDRYFVNVDGSHDIRSRSSASSTGCSGPDDMFAVMTPDMSATDLSFARKTDTVEDNLRRFWFWGQKDDNILPEDPDGARGPGVLLAIPAGARPTGAQRR